MDQVELLRLLITVLEDLGIPYMIGGSQASIYYGEPRYTHDVDVVADLRAEHLPQLASRFPFPEFYLSLDAAREALRGRGQFNIIHPASGLKIDVIIPKDSLYDRIRLQRRLRLPVVPGQEGYFARPEDVILYKMIYYREGGSEKHLRDIVGMLSVSGDDIDREDIARWAGELGLSDIWQAVLRRVEEGRQGS